MYILVLNKKMSSTIQEKQRLLRLSYANVLLNLKKLSKNNSVFHLYP